MRSYVVTDTGASFEALLIYRRHDLIMPFIVGLVQIRCRGGDVGVPGGVLQRFQLDAVVEGQPG